MQSQMFTDSMKSILRVRGVTYQHIAEELDVSESTVKRWFSIGGMSLDQYSKVMDVAKVSFHDLAKIMDAHKDSEIYTFTLTQETFLVKHPTTHAFFNLLIRHGAVGEIKRRIKIPDTLISQSLRHLDSIGLIEWKEKSKYRLRVSRKVAWRKDGPLRKQFLSEAKREFLHSEFNERLSTFRFLNVQLTEKTALDLIDQLSKVANDINHISEMEKSVHPELGDFGVLLAIRPWLFSKLNI